LARKLVRRFSIRVFGRNRIVEGLKECTDAFRGSGVKVMSFGFHERRLVFLGAGHDNVEYGVEEAAVGVKLCHGFNRKQSQDDYVTFSRLGFQLRYFYVKAI